MTMAQSTTGKPSRWDQIPDLPADHPLFKAGFVIGQRRSPPRIPSQPEVPRPMPESAEEYSDDADE
jgi:hypothetical protein